MANLEIGHGLEVLERLKQTVGEFARREERLTRGLESRRSAIAWRFQAATGGEEETEAARLAQVGTQFGDEEARVRRVAKEREARVRRVAAQALRNLPRMAREARGNWLADLQMRLLRADATRAAALDAAQTEAVQVAAALTEECRRLIRLKRAARRALAGYRGLRKRMLEAGAGQGAAGVEGLRMVSEALAEAGDAARCVSPIFLPKIFQYLPLPLAGLVSKGEVFQAASALAEAVVKADRIYEAVRVLGGQAHEDAQKAIQAGYENTRAEISEQWSRVDEIEAEYQSNGQAKIEGQMPRVLARIREQETRRAALLASARLTRLMEIRQESAARREEAARKHEADSAQWIAEEAAEWLVIEEEWTREISQIYAGIAAIQAEDRTRFPEWSEAAIDRWTPPREFPAGAKFAALAVNVEALAGALPRDPRLALPGPGGVLPAARC